MKKEIFDFIKFDRSYRSGKKLYFRYGRNRSFKNALNRQSETEALRSMLFEQLRLLAQIDERSFRTMMAKPVEKPQAAPKEASAHKKKTSKADINSIPDYVKKTIRLREEFPFLKKDDCPPEFKILVADMLTAYEKYTAAHKELFEKISDEKLEELSRSVVDNYLANRQIWEELNHYKQTGEILGNHHIFADYEWMEAYDKMDSNELHQNRERVYNNLMRNKKKIEDDPESEHTAERQERVDSYQRELDYIEKLLGIE